MLLAGPSTDSVADDPEGAEVLAEVLEVREQLGATVRAGAHMASPCRCGRRRGEHGEVNAIPAAVGVRRPEEPSQRDLGLTVAEAMWKAEPVTASARSGVPEPGRQAGSAASSVDDPADLDCYRLALRRLIDDEALRVRIGLAARREVEANFLGTRHLMQYLQFLRELLASRARG